MEIDFWLGEIIYYIKYNALSWGMGIGKKYFSNADNFFYRLIMMVTPKCLNEKPVHVLKVCDAQGHCRTVKWPVVLHGIIADMYMYMY